MTHWMALEGGRADLPKGGVSRSRFAGIGAQLPGRRLTTDELMAGTRCRTGIELIDGLPGSGTIKAGITVAAAVCRG